MDMDSARSRRARARYRPGPATGGSTDGPRGRGKQANMCVRVHGTLHSRVQ